MISMIANRALLLYPESPKDGFLTRYYTLKEYAPLGSLGLPKVPLPPLALMGLQGYFQENQIYPRIDLIDRNVNPKLLEHIIEDTDPDHIFISAINVQEEVLQRDLSILLDTIQFDKPIIIGGPFVFDAIGTEREWVMSLIRNNEKVYLVSGDAETIIDKLLVDLKEGKNQKLYRGVPAQARQFFSPDYSSVNPNDYFAMPLQTSRGCPHSCTFCNVEAYSGKGWRVVSNEYLERAYRDLAYIGWKGNLYIIDDNFMGNPKETIRILNKTAELENEIGYSLPKSCEVSLNLANNTPTMARLRELFRETGFLSMFIGVETNNEEALAEARKSYNLAGSLSLQEKLDYIRKETGVNLMMGCIFGFDSDTRETAEKQIEFINNSSIPNSILTLLNAPYGSELNRVLAAEGRLLSPMVAGGEVCTNVVPKDKSMNEVLELYEYMVDSVYSPEAYFRRVFDALESTNPTVRNISRQLDLPDAIAAVYKVFTGSASDIYRKNFWKAHEIARNRFGFGTSSYRNVLSQYVAFCATYTHLAKHKEYLIEQTKRRAG
ncbi:DUF4070 domain-containing protein [Nanoarchaeota archaeon]